MTPTGWEKMPYFLAVARAGSLRGAAQVLGTTHLKVSRYIQALEAAQGVALISRSQRGIKLTEAGQQLLPVAEEAETMFVQASRSLQGLNRDEKGVVRFSASGPLAYRLVAPILAEFSNKFPQIDLQIHVSTLLEDPGLVETDVSLRIIHDAQDDAIVKNLFPIAIGTFASRQYVSDNFPSAGPKGDGLTWIGSDISDEIPNWVLQSEFPNAEIRHAAADPMMLNELVNNGVGMARLAHIIVSDNDNIQIVPGTKLEDGPPLSILIHPELRRTTRVRRFVDFLEHGLRRLRPLVQAQP